MCIRNYRYSDLVSHLYINILDVHLEVDSARGEDWLVAMVIDHHVHTGPCGGTVAVVEGLHVQQDREAVVFPAKHVLSQRDLQLSPLHLVRVGGIEINLTT